MFCVPLAPRCLLPARRVHQMLLLFMTNALINLKTLLLDHSNIILNNHLENYLAKDMAIISSMEWSIYRMPAGKFVVIDYLAVQSPKMTYDSCP